MELVHGGHWPQDAGQTPHSSRPEAAVLQSSSADTSALEVFPHALKDLNP
jgi:hypothetical protein